ncbi:pyroglutamyl peptidase [Nocardiopsis sp. RSe5-2]|uniref:Pyroglutamyl peptidase n=1 Tax=Nocardiopsis endophytica TaxID=3018445 RepID=A0ABT4U2P4_9ACTN|nr:pyroglutamyl peptidase [Nocardiopsis endophytica]MDA2810627.1 pyroglutamyl peptidase [Nocardiopsis endophytica]
MDATPTTAEEDRARGEAPRLLLRRSGFAAAAPLFTADLAGAAGAEDAARIVTSHGHRLWSEAARSGQAGDDRPLYWARLTLAAILRSWEPPFALAGEERAALLRRLEYASRGHDDLVFAPDDRQLRVIVTGFDPFGLDEDVRRSNPSGAAALALHGTSFEAGGHTAVVRAAVFPVRWRDFTEGMAEQTLMPHYGATAAPADAVITVSRGREGRFDLEAYNGAWRGGRADNEDHGAQGPIPLPGGMGLPDPPPQWCRSTLPRRAIIEGAAGRFPIVDNTEVTEIPAGAEEPVVRPGGPTEGSRARAGGGGGYLSNEIAYRNTLLRDTTGRGIPAGHVHTPKLELATDDPSAVTDPDFERDRADITEQLRAIVMAAVRAHTEAGE